MNHFRLIILVCLLLIAPGTRFIYAQSGAYLLGQKSYKEAPTSVSISSDGLTLLTGFNDGSYCLMDPRTLETRVENKEAHLKAVNGIQMNQEMNLILTAGERSIKRWDREGTYIGLLRGHNTSIWHLEISRDGRYAVSSAINKTFLLWDLPNAKLLRHMQGHSDVCMAVGFSPDSRLLASGSKDQRILIWDVDSGKVVATMHGPVQDVYDIKFSPNGKLLAAASKEENIRLYNLEDHSLLDILKGHRDMVMEVEFSPNGKYLISGSADGSVILWDVECREKIFRYPSHQAAVMDLVFHPDGASFYSVAYSGELSHYALDPEIFVSYYYRESFEAEINDHPLFRPRQEDESRKIYQARSDHAVLVRDSLIRKYYELYLEEH